MMSMSLSGTAILNIKGSNYCCFIGLISENEAINVMQNADLDKTFNYQKLYYHI